MPSEYYGFTLPRSEVLSGPMQLCADNQPHKPFRLAIPFDKKQGNPKFGKLAVTTELFARYLDNNNLEVPDTSNLDVIVAGA